MASVHVVRGQLLRHDDVLEARRGADLVELGVAFGGIDAEPAAWIKSKYERDLPFIEKVQKAICVVDKVEIGERNPDARVDL